MQYNKIDNYLKHNIKSNLKNIKTAQKYLQTIDRFGKWVQENCNTKRVPEKDYVKLAQAYLDSMSDKSSHTLHTYKQHLAKAMDISGKDLKTPKRGIPVKGRDVGVRTDANARIYDVADKIGIRKAEYVNLKGKDIVERSGHLYVHVAKGKGGKEHYQLIKDEYKNDVLALKQGLKDNDFIFTKLERTSLDHAGTHDARRQYARDMYKYFLNMPENEKDFWRKELEKRFLENPRKAERNTFGKYLKRLEKTPTYAVKGANKDKMIADGREPIFDREAVMMVSVFCLAHYREQVTVNNYLV